jgi:hypothetical protein
VVAFAASGLVLASCAGGAGVLAGGAAGAGAEESCVFARLGKQNKTGAARNKKTRGAKGNCGILGQLLPLPKKQARRNWGGKRVHGG